MSGSGTTALSSPAFDVDENTLAAMVSPDADNDKQRLSGLLERFQDDLDPDHMKEFWNTITDSVKAMGFAVELQGSANMSRKGGDGPKLPPAFETASGKAHIRATASLLRISESRAARLTLSALRAYTSKESHLSSLLGTRHLLEIVLKHHFPQRVARLQVIAECLRTEQDEASPHHEASSLFLDELEGEVTVNSRRRGLFQRLLYVACSEYRPPTRNELLPILDLRDDTTTAKREVVADVFVTECMEAARVQALREREEALEALIGLLFRRIDQGIHRVDYVLLLMAFQQCHTFFQEPSCPSRLSHLAGLICIECMSLWYAESAEGDESSWLTRHPLLDGIDLGGSEATPLRVNVSLSPEHELLTVKEMLVKYSRQAAAENAKQSPQSVALLSLGLLLKRVSQSLNDCEDFEKWNTHAMECLQTANDECGAFMHLQSTLETLISSPVSSLPDVLPASSTQPYDWQFSSTVTGLLEDSPEPPVLEINAVTGIYASIGLEVLSSTVCTFRSTVEKDGNISTQNLATLCNLAASVFQNHPSLCEGFWQDLESIPQGGSLVTPNHSVAFLMDTAFSCASYALIEAHSSGALRVEERLLTVLAPLLRLLSSLCSSSDTVERALNSLPSGTIRCALMCCSPKGHISDVQVFNKHVDNVLSSINTLGAIGTSKVSRTLSRSAVEADGSESTADGPRVLFQILSKHSNVIVERTLHTFAFMLQDCSATWSMNAVRCLLSPNGQTVLTRVLGGGNDDELIHAAVLVLNGFVQALLDIAFCKSFLESEIIYALQAITNGVHASLGALSSALSLTSTGCSPQTILSFRTAGATLLTLESLLTNLRPIGLLHASPSIQAAALECRNVLVHSITASTPLGQAIAHFTCAPVSLSLAISLESDLQLSQILNLAHEEHDREDQRDIGAWRKIVSRPGWSNAQDRFTGFDSVEIDLTAIQSRGWAEKEDEPVRAAVAAMRVIGAWALNAEDIVIERHQVGNDRNSISPEAMAELRAISPFALLSSSFVVPPTVRLDSKLLSVWNAVDKGTVADLLLRYIGSQGINSHIDSCSAAAQDVLSVAMAQSTLVGDTKLLAPLRRSTPPICNSAVEFLGATYSQSDNVESVCILQALKDLDFFRHIVNADAGMAVLVVKEDYGLLDFLTDTVHDLALAMRDEASNYIKLLEQGGKIGTQLRFATSSLRVLSSLWEVSSRLGTLSQSELAELKKTLDECKRKTGLVDDAVSIIKAFAKLDRLPHSHPTPSPARQNWLSTLCNATAEAMKLVGSDMLSSDGAQEGERRLFDLLSLPSENFTSIDGAMLVAASNERLKVAKLAPSTLLWSFCPDASSRWSDLGICETTNFSVPAIVEWLSSQWRIEKAEVEAEASSLSASYNLLSCQLSISSAWGWFVRILLAERKPPIGCYSSLPRQVLADLGSNIKAVEECQVLFSEEFLSREVSNMGSSLVAVFLQAISSGDLPSDTTLVVTEEFLEASARLFAVSRNRGAYATVLQRPAGTKVPQQENDRQLLLVNGQMQKHSMIASAVLIERLYPASAQTLSNLLGFIGAAGRNLNLVELLRSHGESVFDVAAQDLLSASIALLTGMTTAVLSTEDPLLFIRLVPFLRDTNSVRALVREAKYASTKASESFPSKIDEAQVTIATSILFLLRLLAEIARDSREVQDILVVDGAISQLLLGNPLVSSACDGWASTDPGSVSMRGYLPSKQGAIVGKSPSVVVGSSLSGRDDPVHGMWLVSLQLTEQLIRTGPLLKDEFEGKADQFFFKMTCDFVSIHREAIMSCLLESCSFPIGSTEGSQGKKSLTFNVLREASSILALLSVLCSPKHAENFAAACPDLYQTSIKVSQVVLSRLSKFLGSSGAARELFRALADFEETVRDNGSADDWDSLDQISPLLSRGIPYARHEAIRNAHCARRCLAFVTPEDYQLFARKRPTSISEGTNKSGQTAAASLERDCQAFIDSDFLVRMENAAAVCVSAAISILWETHPSASCFTMFSGNWDRSDPFSLVKTGMVVALRTESVESERTASKTKEIDFARVLHVDTIRRKFHVRYLDVRPQAPSEETVPAEKLCGIEDLMKRTPTLAFEPAPDSAIELEGSVSNTNSASLGDTLLVLRWCCQYQGEGIDPKTEWTRRLLADRVSILVGAEMSLHREARTSANQASKRINSQLLALFDNSLAGDSAQDRTLKSILSPLVWDAMTRDQLGEELGLARKERSDREREEEKKENGGMPANVSSPWQHLHPASTRKSPFRGLGMSFR